MLPGALQKAVGEDGFSARWGGEEFLIGFDGTVNETGKVLQGFLDDVKSKKFSHNGMEFSISLTIGIATYCEEEKMEEAINRADELLYYGKEQWARPDRNGIKGGGILMPKAPNQKYKLFIFWNCCEVRVTKNIR